MNIYTSETTVIIITGPQGSGKTRFAHALANTYSSFAIINADLLKAPFGLEFLLDGESFPEALVIEEAGGKEWALIEKLATKPKILVERRSKSSIVADTPRAIIFCTGDGLEVKIRVPAIEVKLPEVSCDEQTHSTHK